MQTATRQIDDFFDHEYLDYAKYTISSRAIPSVIDGFKPSQRKIAFIANKIFKSSNDKPLKVFQLAGRIAADAFYHHGNASLESTIIAMAQTFKNSMPVFQGVGQFGSLRSPEAGAPRYVGVKFNENFRMLYKDFDLCTPRYEEGEEIEPDYFLPIIPTVLLNGGSGIAVGFATNILNRRPIDLIDACMNVLDEKPINELRPWINGFTGDFVRSKDDQRSWTILGACSVKNTSTVEVTEIPPSFTYEKYESYLNGLTDKGTISGYDDYSSDKINYSVKFARATLAEIQKKPEKLVDLLRLKETDTENLTTLDENGKLKIFSSAEEIVDYFVKFRIVFYEKRRQKIIENLKSEINVLSAKVKFIKAIVDGEIQVANVKKDKILERIKQLEIPEVDGSHDFLLSMQIHTLTAERYEELMKKIEALNQELEAIMKVTPISLYKKDLKELKKQLEKQQKSQ
jgi:DNA topoisomerase-2